MTWKDGALKDAEGNSVTPQQFAEWMNVRFKTQDEMVQAQRELKEALRIQGGTITKLKSVAGQPMGGNTFQQAVLAKLEGGALDKLINKEADKVRFEIQLKDLAYTGTYGSAAAGQPHLAYNTPNLADAETFDIRFVVPTGLVNDATLEFPRERVASRTDNMGWVAENAETTASAFGFEMATVNSKRATDHLKVSRRALKNSDWLASWINNTLLQKFITKLNTAVIADDGSPSTELSGLLENAQASDMTDYTAKFVDADYFSVMRAARAYMKKTLKRHANTIFLNPDDFAIMADKRTTVGDFVNTGSFLQRDQLGYYSIFGMRVFEAEDITEGNYLIADISPATVQLLFNGPIEFLASDSDDDNFTKNLVTMKIEADVMLPIYNPNAFVKGTLATDLALIQIS